MFGPRPRNYSFKLNKNLKRLARKSALTMKANDKAIVVLEDLKFDTPKTKDFTALFIANSINAFGNKTRPEPLSLAPMEIRSLKSLSGTSPIPRFSKSFTAVL